MVSAKVEKDESVKNPRNAAYTVAARRLRQAHAEEFNALYAEACEEFGIEYKPRMSKAERDARDAAIAKEKAAAKVAALVKQYGEGILDVAFVDPQF